MQISCGYSRTGLGVLLLFALVCTSCNSHIDTDMVSAQVEADTGGTVSIPDGMPFAGSSISPRQHLLDEMAGHDAGHGPRRQAQLAQGHRLFERVQERVPRSLMVT